MLVLEIIYVVLCSLWSTYSVPAGEGAGRLSLGNRNVAFHSWRFLYMCYPGVHTLSILFSLSISLKTSESWGRVPERFEGCVQ